MDVWRHPQPAHATEKAQQAWRGACASRPQQEGQRCAPPTPSAPPPFSQSSALGAGGADLRTSEHRPKKAKRALQALTPEPAAVPALVACVATTGGGSAAAATPIEVWVDGVEHASAGNWE